jgi:hypothetical protein
MPRFVPEEFYPKQKDIDWAIESFKIEKKEVERQLELMIDHEFKRSYTDWNRVFRNWMRKADEIGTLKRPMKRREAPRELTQEEREAEARRAEENMKRLQSMALKVVK